MTYKETRALWLNECDEITRMFDEEGYPSHGANYELCAADAWNFYEEQIEEEPA